jgi:hypothetical protein
MKITAYLKYLERIREKVILNLDDPSRFDRFKRLADLYGLETKPEKTPLDAWYAMLWSGQARIRAPLWAVRMFEKIGDDRLYDPEAKSLDKIFGFTAGAGKTPKVLKSLIQDRLYTLLHEVWVLTLLDYGIKVACEMVARRYQQGTRKQDRELPYSWTLGKGGTAGEYLRHRYGEWRKMNDDFIKRAEPDWRAWLSASDVREKYLQRFGVE